MHLCQAIYTFLVYVLSFDDTLDLLHVSLKSSCSVLTDTYLVYPELLFHINTDSPQLRKRKRSMKVPCKQPKHLSYHGKDCFFVSKQRETKQSCRGRNWLLNY